MVKTLFKFYLPILIISAACFVSACSADFFGLFGSTDLAKRLAERNNFTFLNRKNAPKLVLGDTYSFIVLADTHIEDGDTWGLEKLEDAVINNPDIKFVVFAGDITQKGSEKDIQKFIDIADTLAPLNVPCYPVIGNHDIFFGNWSSWRDLIGSTHYRLDSGETSLLVMDTANAYFGKDQLDWLQSQLESTGRRTFVFTHTNLFVKTPFEFQQLTDTTERARFVSLLRGRCDFMFTGHVHKRIIEEVGGVKYISIEDYRRYQIYCLVSVNPHGISYKFEKL